MANPAFPPQMQQGMPGRPGPGPGPGMGGGIPLAGTMRKGTPKAVPIVVSAGLAVGVFCGLYFGLGTGKAAEAETDSTGSAKPAGPTGPKSAAGASGEVTNFTSGTQPDAAPSDAAPAVAVGSGSGSGSATPGTGSGSATPGTGSGSATPPGTGSGAVPAAITVELSFAITPSSAVVTIDGQPVTGGKATISFTGEKKTIRLVAKASGFKAYDKKITLTKDTAEEAIEIKLPKRSSSGSSRPPRGNDRDPPGGLIDL